MNSSQAAKPCSADEAHEDRLGLIVERVAGQYFLKMGAIIFAEAFPDQIPEESVSKIPRCRFQTYSLFACVPGHVVAIADKFEIMLASQVGDEFFIRV